MHNSGGHVFNFWGLIPEVGSTECLKIHLLAASADVCRYEVLDPLVSSLQISGVHGFRPRWMDHSLHFLFDVYIYISISTECF